jgi:hypothetical protein
MSEVIRFLESMGRAPAVASDYTAEVSKLAIGDAERTALLGRDQNALNKLLGGRSEIRCLVVTPD